MKVRGHCNSGASALTVARRTAFSAPNASQRSRTRTRRPWIDVLLTPACGVGHRRTPRHRRQAPRPPGSCATATDPAGHARRRHRTAAPTGDLRRRQHGSLSRRDTETRGSVGPTGRNPSGSAYRSRCDGTAGIGASEPITASATRAGVRRPAALAFRETVSRRRTHARPVVTDRAACTADGPAAAPCVPGFAHRCLSGCQSGLYRSCAWFRDARGVPTHRHGERRTS